MRALLQRVSQASVSIDETIVATIGKGLLVFLGVAVGDSEPQADWMVRKILALRIFSDQNQAMNLSLTDVCGELLVVSQFTLAADTSRGNRPGFSTAAPPDEAEVLYNYVVDGLRSAHASRAKIATGVFGADMQVQLINDGPVTFLLER